MVIREFGADYIINAEKEDLPKRIQEITDGQLADVVIDTTGTPQSMSQSLNFLRTMENLVLIGTPGENVSTPPLHPDPNPEGDHPLRRRRAVVGRGAGLEDHQFPRIPSGKNHPAHLLSLEDQRGFRVPAGSSGGMHQDRNRSRLTNPGKRRGVGLGNGT